jgi:hypothetical protein
MNNLKFHAVSNKLYMLLPAIFNYHTLHYVRLRFGPIVHVLE